MQHVQCPECESGCSDCDYQGLVCPHCGDSSVFCDGLKCRTKEVAEPVPTLPAVVRPFVGPPRPGTRPVGHRFPLGHRVRKAEPAGDPEPVTLDWPDYHKIDLTPLFGESYAVDIAPSARAGPTNGRAWANKFRVKSHKGAKDQAGVWRTTVVPEMTHELTGEAP